MALDVVANKTMTLLGKTYKPGEIVDTSKLATAKVDQLLNQRWLRPVPPKKPG